MHTVLTSIWIKPVVELIFGCGAGAVLAWQGYARDSAVAGGRQEPAARLALKAGGIFLLAATVTKVVVSFV